MGTGSLPGEIQSLPVSVLRSTSTWHGTLELCYITFIRADGNRMITYTPCNLTGTHCTMSVYAYFHCCMSSCLPFPAPYFFPRSEGAPNYNPGAIPHLFPSARGSSASNLHVQKRNEKKKSHPRFSHDTKCSNDRKTASRTCTTVESDLDLKK